MKIYLKLNASGSWGNVGVFHLDDQDRVKTACLGMAEMAISRMKFKLVDAAGNELAFLDRNKDGEMEWK